MRDEYGKEAIVEILMRRDGMTEKEAKGTIAEFEEYILNSAMTNEGCHYCDVEEAFEAAFSLEPDYLVCFLNF